MKNGLTKRNARIHVADKRAAEAEGFLTGQNENDGFNTQQTTTLFERAAMRYRHEGLGLLAKKHYANAARLFGQNNDRTSAARCAAISNAIEAHWGEECAGAPEHE